MRSAVAVNMECLQGMVARIVTRVLELVGIGEKGVLLGEGEFLENRYHSCHHQQGRPKVVAWFTRWHHSPLQRLLFARLVGGHVAV